MIVIADTTPLNYLVLIGEIDILPALYGTVLIPSGVHQEILRPKAPPVVRAWASNLPSWCRVMPQAQWIDPTLAGLDLGERTAIQLALEQEADILLIDDAYGRREAEQRHLLVVGTVGVLETASQQGLLNFRLALDKLSQTSFRLSATLRQEFLRRNP